MSKFSVGGGGREDTPIPPSMENPVMCYFLVYMIHHSCFYDCAETAWFEKTFLKFQTKMLSANQIARFLSFNITKTI